MSKQVQLSQEVWKCLDCGSLKRRDPGDKAPLCGELSSDVTRFPDGGWVRIEQWFPHPSMELVGVEPRFDETLVGMVEGAHEDRAAAMLAAAEESVRRSNEAAGIAAPAAPAAPPSEPTPAGPELVRCDRLVEGASCLLRASHAGDCVSAHTIDRWIGGGVEFSIDALEG